MAVKPMHRLLPVLVPLLLLLVTCNGATDPVTPEPVVCAEGCICRKSFEAECKVVSRIPNFTDKSVLKKLVILSHRITELNKDSFVNFTHLEQLEIREGTLRTVLPGTFDTIKDTIQEINFRSNGLVDIDKGVFTNLPNLVTLTLNTNHIVQIKADTFVNMSKLLNLHLLSNQIVSVDKEALKGLNQLTTIDLFDNRLTGIPFESLAGLPSLKLLVLTRNKITTIPETAPVFVPTLEDLYLDSNDIAEIKVFPNISNSLKRLDLDFTNLSKATKDTWKFVPNLDLLNLGGCQFKTITVGTFEGLGLLKKLILRDMPILESIGPDAFRGIGKATTVDLFDCKQLRTIDESAFKSVQVSSLFIGESGVTYIPKGLLNWSELHTVKLAHLPINCDCKVEWMLDSSIFGNNTSVKESFDELVCETPKEHYEKQVTSLHPVNLTCKKVAHSKRFLTGIIVAIICLVFFITMALLFKFRKQIMISCHRYYQYRKYQNDMVFTVEHDTSIAELEDTDIEGRPLKNMRLETVPIDT